MPVSETETARCEKKNTRNEKKEKDCADIMKIQVILRERGLRK